MFKNYLTVAWRNLMKNKIFSLINILGLTIGITVCLMISLYIMNEFGYDHFHKNGEHIYRVMRVFDRDGQENRVPYLAGPYGPALQNDYSADIRQMVRVDRNEGLISIGDKAFNEKNILAVDSNFFQFFSFTLLRGNKTNVLNDPSNIVLTENTAKKYFGSIDAAMDKTILMDKSVSLNVTGIVQDPPPNSHIQFNMLFSIGNYNQYSWFHEWINNGLFTYIELSPNTDVKKLEQKFPAYMEKYMGEQMRKTGINPTLSLTPLHDIYFEPSMSFDSRRQGDKSVVYIFLSVALLILLIACINFTNLSTIRAVERSKEVGLRKVLGAVRNHLIWQFIGESLLLTAVSCIMSLALVKLLLPIYSDFLGYDLSFIQNIGYLLLFLLGIILLVGFLAGGYPALVISSFTPIQALKGKLKLGNGGTFFRQTLVVIQFSISILLIIGVVVIVKQMSYVKNKQLGYNQDQEIIVRLNNNEISRNKHVFKQQLLTNSHVVNVSLMSGEPGGFYDGYYFDVDGQAEPWHARTVFSDFDYVQTLQLNVIAGRDFSPAFGTDSTNAVLINQTAANELGFTPGEALGKHLLNKVRDSLPRTIVGVVEDFNFLSLKEKIQPLVITLGRDRRVALIKVKPTNITSTVDFIKTSFNQFAPVYPFEYNFLDEKFGEMYKSDLRQQRLLAVFAGLAIFIACLGLFGLASFTTAKRTKEIGVRKVVGSSTSNIVMLLSSSLLKPVLIAAFIAIPTGYYFMYNWLQNFAYRTTLDWWVFLLAITVTVIIALITVGTKAINAALANPVKSLRSE